MTAGRATPLSAILHHIDFTHLKEPILENIGVRAKVFPTDPDNQTNGGCLYLVTAGEPKWAATMP